MKPSHALSGACELETSPAILKTIRGPGNLEKTSGEIIEAEAGISGIEATTAVWGKGGKWLVIVGCVSRHRLFMPSVTDRSKDWP